MQRYFFGKPSKHFSSFKWLLWMGCSFLDSRTCCTRRQTSHFGAEVKPLHLMTKTEISLHLAFGRDHVYIVQHFANPVWDLGHCCKDGVVLQVACFLACSAISMDLLKLPCSGGQPGFLIGWGIPESQS